MNDQNTRLVRRALDEVFAAGDLTAVDQIFHPEFVNHEAGPRTPPGPEGLKMTVGWLHESFSDMHYEIEDEILAGDKVVVRVTATGRHTGPFIGFPATGKRYSVEQIHIYRIADGKIVEHWSSRDDLGQAMQLGFVPGRRPDATVSAAAAMDVADGQRSPATPASRPIGKASEVPIGGGRILAKERLVLTQPEAGQFKAFSAICTHMGCTVGKVTDGLIKCPCHGSEFSIADGSVRHGPAPEPLEEYRVLVVGGEISLEAPAGAAARGR